jgi:hypothetical protein
MQNHMRLQFQPHRSQYCAVDSITAFSTPCYLSHVDKRDNSLGIVAKRRRSGFDSGVRASITTTIRTFLCTSIPATLPAIATSWSESGRKRGQRHHTPSRATKPSQWERRDTDWFKHASQTKLFHGLNLSRVGSVFAVTRQFDRKTSRLAAIFIPMGGPKVHAELFPYDLRCPGDSQQGRANTRQRDKLATNHSEFEKTLQPEAQRP